VVVVVTEHISDRIEYMYTGMNEEIGFIVCNVCIHCWVLIYSVLLFYAL